MFTSFSEFLIVLGFMFFGFTLTQDLITYPFVVVFGGILSLFYIMFYCEADGIRKALGTDQ